MAQIRSDIFYNQNIKDIQNKENKVRHFHIAIPIIPEEESDNSDDDDNQVVNEEGENSARNPNNDNEIELVTKENEECWNSIITEWINSVEHENQFDNTDDATFLSSEWDTNFELGGRTIHPADDDSAKWPLDLLFITNLELPNFLEKNKNITDD